MKKDLKDERRYINRQINDSFSILSTPLIADACLRLKIPFRLPPPGLHALIPTVPGDGLRSQADNA